MGTYKDPLTGNRDSPMATVTTRELDDIKSDVRDVDQKLDALTRETLLLSAKFDEYTHQVTDFKVRISELQGKVRLLLIVLSALAGAIGGTDIVKLITELPK